jgi:hypothetical protein
LQSGTQIPKLEYRAPPQENIDEDPSQHDFSGSAADPYLWPPTSDEEESLQHGAHPKPGSVSKENQRALKQKNPAKFGDVRNAGSTKPLSLPDEDSEETDRSNTDTEGSDWEPSCKDSPQHGNNNSSEEESVVSKQQKQPVGGVSKQDWKRSAPQFGTLPLLMEATAAMNKKPKEVPLVGPSMAAAPDNNRAILPARYKSQKPYYDELPVMLPAALFRRQQQDGPTTLWELPAGAPDPANDAGAVGRVARAGSGRAMQLDLMGERGASRRSSCSLRSLPQDAYAAQCAQSHAKDEDTSLIFIPRFSFFLFPQGMLHQGSLVALPGTVALVKKVRASLQVESFFSTMLQTEAADVAGGQEEMLAALMDNMSDEKDGSAAIPGNPKKKHMKKKAGKSKPKRHAKGKPGKQPAKKAKPGVKAKI